LVAIVAGLLVVPTQSLAAAPIWQRPLLLVALAVVIVRATIGCQPSRRVSHRDHPVAAFSAARRHGQN
jgi:hypothetical protein